MSKGKIKEFDASRGCGTIVDSETGEQLTFYANYVNLEKGEVLNGGQEVEYEMENTRHTRCVINVRVL